jgi:uncharacterized protein (DUF952 family)
MASGADEGARDLTRIFHITSDDAWTTARANGAYAADSLATEGFIHCSDAHQVVWVANQRFRGRQDLVLLHIDPLRLGCEVRYENLEGGEQLFPHIYGPLPVAAVVDVVTFRPAADGSFLAERSEKFLSPDVDPAVPPSSSG